MIRQIVEIASPGRYLSLYRGFLKVSEGEEEVGRVALDRIEGVILSAPDATLSRSVMSALMAHGAVVVVCGENYLPEGLLMPVALHHETTGNFHSQLSASEPLRKRLWQQLIVHKIRHQALTLKLCGVYPEREGALLSMSESVRSGDPDNLEAQAARAYWSALLGEGFTREPKEEGINTLLNYGYAVLRASVARALSASGLHPSLGLKHKNTKNPFCLADDLMEPYRPIVDRFVLDLAREGGDGTLELNPEAKRTLASILAFDMQSDRGSSTLSHTILRTAQSLTQSFKNKTPELLIGTMQA